MPISYYLAIAATVTFSTTGVLAVRAQHPDIFAVVVIGIVTAAGGGIIRDLLAHRPTLILSRDLYATPICLGVVLQLVLLKLAGLERLPLWILFRRRLV